MLAFDASAVIHAWDNYPKKQFPPLWNWIASQVQEGEFLMPRVAFEETKDKVPECATWLKDNSIQRIEVSNDILQEAMRIKSQLGIQEDHYHAKGVGENDILIIASAFVQELELVSEEARQNNLPQVKKKMKIPAVCKLQIVRVPCINFIEWIKRSEKVFR